MNISRPLLFGILFAFHSLGDQVGQSLKEELVLLRIVKINGSAVVAEIEGDFCGYFARKTSKLFDSCVMRGVKAFVLDMSQCRSIDSLGVQTLRNLSCLRLRLVNTNWSVRETCRAESFDLKDIDGFTSVEKALESLNANVITHEELALCDFTVHNLNNYIEQKKGCL